MSSRTIACGLAVAVFAVQMPDIALAEKGTEQQREACTPDVFRLCGQFIPDAEKIEACLRSAGPRLSPACRVVFSAPQPPVNQATPIRERPPRDQILPPAPAENGDDD